MVAAAAIQLQREGVALPAALGMFSPAADLDQAQGLDTPVTLIGVDPLLATPVRLRLESGNEPRMRSEGGRVMCVET